MEITLKSARTVPISEWSSKFLQMMLNSMCMSYFKFGYVRNNFPKPVDSLATLESMLSKYRKSGNSDYLVDIANYAMIEYMHPSVEGVKYAPGDPGVDSRTWREKT